MAEASREVESLQKKLNTLVAELESLPKRIEVVAHRGDLEDLENLQVHRERLPSMISATELQLWRNEVLLQDAQAREFATVNVPKAQKELDRQQAAFDEAEKKLCAARNEYLLLISRRSPNTRGWLASCVGVLPRGSRNSPLQREP